MEGNVAIGITAIASNAMDVVIGAYAKALPIADNAISIGTAAISSGSGGCISIGAISNAFGVSAISIGPLSKAAGIGSISVGSECVAGGVGAISIGETTKAAGAIAIALGAEADSAGDLTIAIGNAATASGNTSIAIGSGVESIGNSSIGIGSGMAINGQLAIGIGSGVTADGAGCVSIGNGATSTGLATIAIGNLSTAAGTGGIAIGNSTTAEVNSIAIGNTATPPPDAIQIGNEANLGLYLYGMLPLITARYCSHGIAIDPVTRSVGFGPCAGCALSGPLEGDLDVFEGEEFKRSQTDKFMALRPLAYRTRNSQQGLATDFALIAPEAPEEFRAKKFLSPTKIKLVTEFD